MSTNVEIGRRRIEAINRRERKLSSAVYFFDHAQALEATGLES
jgi:hypothetical protein